MSNSHSKRETWLGKKLERICECFCQNLHIYLLSLILGWFLLSRKTKICFKSSQVASLKVLSDSCFYVFFYKIALLSIGWRNQWFFSFDFFLKKFHKKKNYFYIFGSKRVQGFKIKIFLVVFLAKRLKWKKKQISWSLSYFMWNPNDIGIKQYQW